MTIYLKIKNIISFILYYMGILDITKSIKLKNKAFVLMYHRVINSDYKNEHYIQPGMYVTKDTFEMHVRLLKKKFNVISIEELIERIKNNENISGCCSITFDDGWSDNYENAFPILKKYNVPAIIFLATGYIGTTKWFWPEDVSFYLLRILKNKMKVDNIEKNIQKILLDKNLSKIDKVDLAIEKLKTMDIETRKSFIKQLHNLFSIKERDKLLMDWNQVKEMNCSSLVSFGAHTVNHEILTQIVCDNVKTEILLSRENIEKTLKNNVDFFAYPNGNFSEEIVETIIKNSFRGAVTTKKGYVEHKTHLMKIPRVGIHDDVGSTKYLFFSRILLRKF